MEQSTLNLLDTAHEWLVWLVGGNPEWLHYLKLALFGTIAGFCMMRCWREMYTVIDTLNKIWQHILWSVLYALLFFLCAVQAYYAYTHLFGPMSDLPNLSPPEDLAETIGGYRRIADWVEWMSPNK